MGLAIGLVLIFKTHDMNASTVIFGLLLVIFLLVILIIFRKQIKSLVSGKSKILPRSLIKYIINCADPPFVPSGYILEKHQPGDKDYEFDAVKVFLFQPKKQEKDILTGDEFIVVQSVNTNLTSLNSWTNRNGI